MKSKTATLFFFTLKYSEAKMQKLNMKMENFKREARNPTHLPKKLLNHKAQKEHKDFLFVFSLNPKSKILNPNLSFLL